MLPSSVRGTAKVTDSDRAIKVLQPAGSHKINPNSHKGVIQNCHHFQESTLRGGVNGH